MQFDGLAKNYVWDSFEKIVVDTPKAGLFSFIGYDNFCATASSI